MSDKIIAVEKSAGGINRYCHYCNVNCKQTLYSICLHTIDYVNRGGTTNFDRCEQAIKTNHCPAQAMREQELNAGKALYFSEWVVTQPEPEAPAPIELPKIDKSSDAYQRGWNAVPAARGITSAPIAPRKSLSNPPLDKPVKPKEAGDEMMTMDVSKMVEDAGKAPSMQKLDTSRLPGETTIAYVNRIKAAKQAQARL